MKTCFKCFAAKPITEFYPHPQMGDGHLNKCKTCTRKDAEERRRAKLMDPQWAMKEAARQRAKAKRVPAEIIQARASVRRLGRSRCYHWHHWSYLPEHKLNVIKLSPAGHRKAHTGLKYDKDAMMYRRSDTMELLSTRREHEAYLYGVMGILPEGAQFQLAFVA